MDCDFYRTLTSRTARFLFGFEVDFALPSKEPTFDGDGWIDYFSQSVRKWPQRRDLLPIGNAAFNAFLQSNVTGPPLSWNSANVIFPSSVSDESTNTLDGLRKQLTASLGVDGETIYQLTPNIELFYVAKGILDYLPPANDPLITLARLRVNFWHQRMLSDVSPTMQDKIHDDLKSLEVNILIKDEKLDGVGSAQFLIERANIHTYYGNTAKAKDDLRRAAEARSFDFGLTGRLGKRTKFQEKELSQLVVLAKSANAQEIAGITAPDSRTSHPEVSIGLPDQAQSAPQALNLNDDTLLESISFTAEGDSSSLSETDADLPLSLQSLDPGNQPLLDPLDAIILLATASSITNTSPTDGLTREETLPYAERVISGGSSNWQVYTQALLVRSRIEGYRSRTVERGVLQLQAVVDQLIAETTALGNAGRVSSPGDPVQSSSTTFLPKPQRAESAPVSERLQYIHQLASPLRWKLESELADRWVSLGGLRTALEIYERLQMWAEVALCWAVNDQEDTACTVIKKQLFTDESNPRAERDPLPADAPRLFCILGDIENDIASYERAWQISNCRYARAQRSLGKHFSAVGDLMAADEAYVKALKINPQNHSTWFALGCIRLQTKSWAGAIEAFGRTIEIDDTDAESWSNLAVALLNLPPDALAGAEANGSSGGIELDDEQNAHESPKVDPQKHIREAFFALKRASTLKRDSFRIWQNLLTVSVKLSPPPYPDIVIAQVRLIDLLGKLEGEKCVDVDIADALVAHLIATSPSFSGRDEDSQNSVEHTEHQPSRNRGLAKMIMDLVQKKITPLITSSRRLWLLTAKLSLHLGHASAALASYEKAWRATLNQPAWESGGGTEAVKTAWMEVSQSTMDLVDAYESLGERKREPGMGAGELVAKDWKFKARSALRSILAKAKNGWEDDASYESLNGRLQELKGL